MGFFEKFIYDKPWKKDSMFAVRMLSWVCLSVSRSLSLSKKCLQLYTFPPFCRFIVDLCLMTNLSPFDCSCLGKSQRNKKIRKFIATTISRHFLKQYWCCSGIVIIFWAGVLLIYWQISLSLSQPSQYNWNKISVDLLTGLPQERHGKTSCYPVLEVRCPVTRCQMLTPVRLAEMTWPTSTLSPSTCCVHFW